MYQKLLQEGIIVPKEEVPPPTVPMDFSWARVSKSTSRVILNLVLDRKYERTIRNSLPFLVRIKIHCWFGESY